MIKKIFASKLMFIGLGLIAALFFVAVLAPFIAPHTPAAQNLPMRLAAPGRAFGFAVPRRASAAGRHGAVWGAPPWVFP